MSVQRFRVRFRKGERVRYISHLDVLRSWERAIRRAELPLSYSQGFTPHPKIAFASPLPLGFVSEAEIMDVSLDERVSAADFESRLAVESSPDLALLAIEEIALTAPPPQAALLWADYTADVPDLNPLDAEAAACAFLALGDFPWTEERKEKLRTYNLRSTVALLSAQPLDGGTRLSMRLQADQEMTARPEQVMAAVFPGAEATLFCRRGLVIDEPSPARDAWRRRGQFE
ncbi:MAG: TIGR03936 family radical SAM-associated protein [Tepidiformaceae bacterium]